MHNNPIITNKNILKNVYPRDCPQVWGCLEEGPGAQMTHEDLGHLPPTEELAEKQLRRGDGI